MIPFSGFTQYEQCLCLLCIWPKYISITQPNILHYPPTLRCVPWCLNHKASILAFSPRLTSNVVDIWRIADNWQSLRRYSSSVKVFKNMQIHLNCQKGISKIRKSMGHLNKMGPQESPRIFNRITNFVKKILCQGLICFNSKLSFVCCVYTTLLSEFFVV